MSVLVRLWVRLYVRLYVRLWGRLQVRLVFPEGVARLAGFPCVRAGSRGGALCDISIRAGAL